MKRELKNAIRQLNNGNPETAVLQITIILQSRQVSLDDRKLLEKAKEHAEIGSPLQAITLLEQIEA